MKKQFAVKLLAVLALAGFALPGNAQDLEHPGLYGSAGYYGSAYVGFGLGSYSSTGKSQSFIDYYYAAHPLGIGANNFCGDIGFENHEYSYKKNGVKFTMSSLRLPVTFRYRIPISDEIFISPNVGAYAAFNYSGKLKDTDTGVELNVFKKQSWASEDYVYKHIQFGWLAGIRIDTYNLYFALYYGRDITNLQKATKLKAGIASITVGYYIN